jgi:HEXXH motif-containing protein
MPLLKAAELALLQAEFRQSMRILLADLCRDIEDHYSDLAARLDLPIGYFRFLSDSFDRASYSNWKVVGWIETLNDLVYFLDLLRQAERERDPTSFADQLHAECEERFFEDNYLHDLFPRGKSEAKGLTTRLQRLCANLARETTQEALFLAPWRAIQWCGGRGTRRWEVPGCLGDNFERAEAALVVPVGLEGEELVAPRAVRQAVGSRERPVTFEVDRRSITLRRNGRFPIGVLHDGMEVEWFWPKRAAVIVARTPSGPMTVGSTLEYGRDRQPRKIIRTSRGQAARIERAWETLRQAWPEGHAVLELLTSRVIPLKAQGVVSFSYRHRPGLSFINCFDRSNLDLIDDLIHENSHHHLNLLLRKHVMYRGDHNEQIFYSPWRRTLRPLRGILHAAFTFTMGALLFERLSAFGRRHEAAWRRAGLTKRDLLRARFRCLEEVESVRYAIQDLDYAGRHLKWITGSGARLVRQLQEEINKAEHRIAPHRDAVLASPFGAALRRHNRELRQARQLYGPIRLTKA